ncbi:DUF4240 domain-containing protein [Kordia sp.]|uniref:DUF4240 domain-containing protein n=1 Tax=Kordia sp. TaxID=1965332 RepID=UPI003B5A9F7E
MGIFDWLFGKKESKPQAKPALAKQKELQLEKTSKALNIDVFWEIIEKSLKNTNNQEAQIAFLKKELQQLTLHEIIGFRIQTDALLFDTYSSEMWCAAYIMNGGCSDDAFEYFRNWLISRGKETYENAKENPDSLINEVLEEDYYGFEDFWYVALDVFQQKTGKDAYDYIDYDNIHKNEGKYVDFEFTWEEDEPESMKKICPKLFEKLWDE